MTQEKIHELYQIAANQMERPCMESIRYGVQVALHACINKDIPFNEKGELEIID